LNVIWLGDDLAPIGKGLTLSVDRAMRRLFVVDENGDLVAGLDPVEAKRCASEHDLTWQETKSKPREMLSQPIH
jgi:hypothetical protein